MGGTTVSFISSLFSHSSSEELLELEELLDLVLCSSVPFVFCGVSFVSIHSIAGYETESGILINDIRLLFVPNYLVPAG